MFPLEIVTMLGAAVVGGVLKIMDRKADREDKMLAAIHTGDQLRMDAPAGVQWTRRVIALTIVFAVMILPKVAALYGLPLVYGSEVSRSFLWGIFVSGPFVEWYTIGGMPITPLDTHAMAAVVGFFFGGRRT